MKVGACYKRTEELHEWYLKHCMVTVGSGTGNFS